MIKTSLLFVYFTLSHIYISWYFKKKTTYKHLKINDFLLIFPIST
jgi:hypothetical protein